MARKPIPLRPQKFYPSFVKFCMIFFGILLLISSLVAIILSFVLFWEAACDSCASVQCSCDSSGNLVSTQAKDMDWSFLWLDIYFFVAVIVGPILIANGVNMVTKKGYLKQYPYAAFCPNCGTLCDKRGETCPNCGTVVDETGEWKDAERTDARFADASDTTNPYEAYWQNRNGGGNGAPPTDDGSNNPPTDENN